MIFILYYYKLSYSKKYHYGLGLLISLHKRGIRKAIIITLYMHKGYKVTKDRRLIFSYHNVIVVKIFIVLPPLLLINLPQGALM